ncbi:hypothetical protein NQ318_009081 [Aromia moschata]|uniref:ABC transporter domain-containing protein n=1 Tax=Aromia moschata TaxID=1265417 RepID=A0AAV8YTV0_9CUCU|nr:hypothetical protein NQ318_009081 [Aromia moschata]
MDEERHPLLAGPSRHNSERKFGENNNSDPESVSLKLNDLTNSFYGTESGTIGKLVPAEERITYTWNSIHVFTPSKETVRRKYICCGKTTVTGGRQNKHILKKSGAGKSTLLNALTFRPTKDLVITGLRCVNGVPVNPKSLTSRSAYVQQDDLFIGSLTVREHLVFQALVRMDRGVSYERRMKRVEEVLSELSLKKCENTTIGTPGRIKGISGGEKKRLSFAAEVLTNPSLLFCDEPTSGLDSFMALNVVQVLKSLAQTGKTVVCTIHQPSSELYAMFDKLLLMADGRGGFFGHPRGGVRVLCRSHFLELEAPCPRNYNPADYFIQLLAIVPEKEESCHQAIAMICDKFERSDIGVQMIVKSAMRVKEAEYFNGDIWLNGHKYESPYKASWLAQFRAVLWRSWLSSVKEPLLVKVRLLQTMVYDSLYTWSNLLWTIDYSGRSDEHKRSVVHISDKYDLQNVFAVINVFCSELPVFLREHRNGMYRTDVYFLAKTIAETPIFILMPIVFTSICYYLIGLNPKSDQVLHRLWNSNTRYMISCLSANVSMALSVGPPLIIPFLLFGGFFLNVNSIPVYLQWLSYLSWFKYGNEALMINQWEDVMDIQCSTANSTCPRTGHIVLQTYSFSEDHLPIDIIALCCLIVGFRMVAYLSLVWKTYRHN